MKATQIKNGIKMDKPGIRGNTEGVNERVIEHRLTYIMNVNKEWYKQKKTVKNPPVNKHK